MTPTPSETKLRATRQQLTSALLPGVGDHDMGPETIIFAIAPYKSCYLRVGIG